MIDYFVLYLISVSGVFILIIHLVNIFMIFWKENVLVWMLEDPDTKSKILMMINFTMEN